MRARDSAYCSRSPSGLTIAVMAPVWEAMARHGNEMNLRYFRCRHELLAVSVASGYYKATGRSQIVFLPTSLGVQNGSMALGTALQERTLAERWGVIFTPTIVFFKDDLAGLDGKWGRELEAIERLPLSYGRDTFYDLFVWVRHKLYERDRSFQRFHISRIAEREALKSKAETGGRTN